MTSTNGKEHKKAAEKTALISQQDKLPSEWREKLDFLQRRYNNDRRAKNL